MDKLNEVMSERFDHCKCILSSKSHCLGLTTLLPDEVKVEENSGSFGQGQDNNHSHLSDHRDCIGSF